MGYNFSHVHKLMNSATANKARLDAEIDAMRAKPEDDADEDKRRLYDVLLGASHSLTQLMDIIEEKEF